MTRGELKAFVRGFGYGTDTDTVVDTFLLAALQELEGRRQWQWMQTWGLDVDTLPAGAFTLAHDARTSHVKQVALSVTAQARYDIPLRHISLDTLTEYSHEDRTAAVPRYWSDDGTNIYFYPRADIAYSVSLLTIVRTDPALFSGDGQSPPFDPRFHTALGWRALEWLALRQRDPASADRFKNEYEAQVREMEQADDSDLSASHIRRSDYWDNVSPR